MSEAIKQKDVPMYVKNQLIRSWLDFEISTADFLYKMKSIIDLKV